MISKDVNITKILNNVNIQPMTRLSTFAMLGSSKLIFRVSFYLTFNYMCVKF